MIIGICGGTASGKTIFAKKIVELVGEEFVLYLDHDAYYLGLEELPPSLRCEKNFDHPDSLDNALFITHLQQLRANQPIDQPIYDFTTHRRTPNTCRISPKPIILVDGILIFAVEHLRWLFDIKVYIDAEPDIRLTRRLQRDIFERGRTPQSVIEQYLKTVRPMHQQFVEPSKHVADIIIHGKIEKHNTGLDLLVTKIKAYLADVSRATPAYTGQQTALEES
ncbi:uridine kinase [candidate division KSB3 bacterium]|uniref:Uridine kinase n=1 Tax=candidate division KSB3 bacterium TaxID=2044937 RepID=A0A9D5Q6Y7_9BACT|nr:uridine kinase [candidate division KSB3 bacterium]MBD3326295.1 uridine kinase [candidate division KSB3 bacterium]